MEHPIQRIVQDWGASALVGRRVAPYVGRAVRALRRCRTAALGGHVQRCTAGHVVGVWYNGCGHRSCPRCGWRKAQAWIERRLRELLPCDHYHLVFTMPSCLRLLWVMNPRAMANLLFAAVSGTLLDLLGNPRHLGVVPGLTLTLHTWSKSLQWHPHLHALVTGGGLLADGSWRACRNGFLLPVRMLTPVYRGKLLSSLERALRRGELRLPAGMDGAGALAVLRAATKVRWRVWVAQRYAHGQGVVRYLSAHLRGGPIHDGRIVSYDGATVCMALRGQERVVLPAAEFTRRLLQHVPPPNSRVVRHYGLYAHTQSEARERARRQLPARTAPLPARSPTNEVLEDAKLDLRCPQCGAAVVREVIPRGSSPPIAWPGWVAA